MPAVPRVASPPQEVEMGRLLGVAGEPGGGGCEPDVGLLCGACCLQRQPLPNFQVLILLFLFWAL